MDFMQYLGELGYLCVLHDHRGHGKSIRREDDLGYMGTTKAAALIEDIRQLNAQLHREYPSLKIYMFGHSMGSLAVRAYLKRYDDTIDALIVCGSPSSPLIQKMAFGNHCDGFAEEGSDNVWLCSDMEVVRAYDHDPLCGYTFTLNGFENLFSLMQDVYERKNWTLRNRTLPIRFIAGSEDPCIIRRGKFQEAAGLLREVGYSDVSARLFDGMRHEILNEPDHLLVYEDVSAFLLKVEEKNT